MPNRAAIAGWGRYVPQRVVTNDELALTLQISDGWIRTRTGIRERRIAGPGETTSTMCVQAARRALERAELDAADIDLVICATTTPDHLLPATACLVQREIGAARAGAFDLNAACCGLLSALTVADQFIRCGTCARVLVVAGETLSRFLDWRDRSTCVLFGDGASALVVESTDQDCGVLSSVLGSWGDLERVLTIEAGGSARPASAETVAQGAHHVRMRGNGIFKLAVRAMKEAASEALARAGLS
jgi:3-oxoacyl-[acyl-carrier-protein] synthase-3